MADNQEKTKILIRYPRIRGYILKSYELQQLLTTCFEAAIELQEHAEHRLDLVLDETTIHSETASEHARINHRKCVEAVRKNNIAEHRRPASPSEPEQKIDDDPDHRQWLNSVCSGE